MLKLDDTNIIDENLIVAIFDIVTFNATFYKPNNSIASNNASYNVKGNINTAKSVIIISVDDVATYLYTSLNTSTIKRRLNRSNINFINKFTDGK